MKQLILYQQCYINAGKEEDREHHSKEEAREGAPTVRPLGQSSSLVGSCFPCKASVDVDSTHDLVAGLPPPPLGWAFQMLNPEVSCVPLGTAMNHSRSLDFKA